MKAVKLFFGTNSHGRGIEYALGINGVWYVRYEERTCYGNQFTKWAASNGPTFETHGVYEHTGETFEYPEPQAFAGFTKLMEAKGPLKVRLPNA